MAWPISPEFAAALNARDRSPIYRADVLNNGIPVLSGMRVQAGGNVAVNSSQSPRRTVTLTVIDDGGDLVPGDPGAALAPYGNELAVYYGLTLPTGAEWVPVGLFRIDVATAATAGGVVTVALTGSDRSARVADDDLTDYLTLSSGTLVSDAILDLITTALPANQAYSFDPTITATITGQTYQPGDDRWAQATTLAANAGALLFFDAAGVCTLSNVPDPTLVTPAYTFAPGASSVAVSAQNSLDRTAAANTIVVTAQGTGVATPVTAIAQDTDPTSPTYVGGPFGRVVKTISTSIVGTLAAAQVYADSQLLLYSGATQQAQLTCVPLPHLDAYDVIATGIPAVKLTGRYAIDQISLPLGPGTMSITTRGIVV